MRKLLALLFCVLSPGLAFAGGNVITATVAVTNSAGTTNGQTIAVGADTRTWTNSVSVPSVQILTNNTAGGSATNLFNHLANYGFAGLSLTHSGTNGVALQGYPGATFTVSISDGWGSVSYATNYLTNAIVVRVPYTIETPTQQTNITSALVSAIDSSQNTNAIHESSPVAVNLLGVTNAQTVAGAKSFTNSSGLWGGSVNSASIGGTVGSFTNGGYLNPTTTNLINYGNPIGSPGSGGVNSFEAGNGANASGSSSTSVGASSKSTGSFASAFGYQASATNVGSVAVGLSTIAGGYAAIAIGTGANAMETNTVAIGRLANVAVGHTNSMALGYNAATTAANQLMIGSPSVSTVVNNNLTVGGGMTVANGITNAAMVGTNVVQGDIAYPRYALSSLANGNNAAIPIGTNVFVEVSGPTGSFTICGINGQPNRDGKVVKIKNNTGFTMTIANESGTDPTAANRIQTGLTADEAFTNHPAMVTLIYDGTAQRWIIDSHN